ncbi:MAG: LAO/AO transport system kinase [Polyangiales bacterium]|jgi:LAO/AO transport system kinase
MSDVLLDDLEEGIRAGDVFRLSRAITLVESERADHMRLGAQLLGRLGEPSTPAFRLGVSGTPGVGKSTFIETFGRRRTGAGRRVAVLAIDPSSRVSGGSILGDKTRMSELARDPLAFVRPSPTSGRLGGVARKTREAIVLCEAAGFDDVIVETVGVGQSEIGVSDMVDETLVLLLPRSGDSLQGIKRGILEAADVVVIHKADGDLRLPADAARSELESALRLMRGEAVPVLTASSLTGDGIPELEELLDVRRAERCDATVERRRAQNVRWLWRLIDDVIQSRLRQAVTSDLEAQVFSGELHPREAAEQVLGQIMRAKKEDER